MGNLKIKILVAITAFTFAFSFGIFLQRRYPRLFWQPVSLCTVTKYRSLYQTLRGSEIVTLRGNLYGEKILSFGDTNLKGCEDSVAEVSFDDDQKLSSEIQDLVRELRLKTNDGNLARAEVEIIGTLEERKQHCFSSHYLIKAVQITPIGSPEVVDASSVFSELHEAR